MFTSAANGFEKPHPEAFRHALRACGHVPRAWMVGDNPVADVDGARAAGLDAVLVHHPDGGVSLREAAARIVGDAPPHGLPSSRP